MTRRRSSDRPSRILAAIQASVAQRGYPPSIREIARQVGISSTSLVEYHLRRLEQDGTIRRDHEVSRGIELLQTSGASGSAAALAPLTVSVPVIGRIAAGAPIEAIEDPSDTLGFAPGDVPEGCFALRVQGTSMIEDQIDDGDVVIVRPDPSPPNGAIVVAIVRDHSADGGATLKRFYREGASVRLQPRNPDMRPLLLPADQVEVRGRVVKLIRDF